MKSLILYDSIYGNTEKIATAIGTVLHGEVLRVNDSRSSKITEYDLVIVGSPVHGGRPTPAIEVFIKNLPSDSLKGIKVAAFDTRFAPEDHGIGLRIVMHVIRFAAERIAKSLQKTGGTLVGKPQGFIVENKEGPLKKGEIERAAHWAKEVSRYD